VSSRVIGLSAILAVTGLTAGSTGSAGERACRADVRTRPAAQVRVSAGVTTIGSDRFEPEEQPRRSVSVGPFSIDRFEVTNARFAAFVAATGYVTQAERAGGAVFTPPRIPGDGWWRLDRQASWRHPQGAGSRAEPDQPVVQVTQADALAYARWLGRDLPTEAEWERAARGGLTDADYSWGEAPPTDARPRANVWQGVFPIVDSGTDGHRGLAPVGCYDPNDYGLFDMAGNAWELTRTAWSGGAAVIKGGSWLCSDNYCMRYRPAARQAADLSLGTNHIGFRTVRRQGES
jgi:formylglycine-generating enzyme